MKKINKLLNLLINYVENLYKLKILDRKEYENLCNIFPRTLDETKNETF